MFFTKQSLFKQRKSSDSDSEDADENQSVLSEIDNEENYFENKIQYQRRALFRKNATL